MPASLRPLLPETPPLSSPRQFPRCLKKPTAVCGFVWQPHLASIINLEVPITRTAKLTKDRQRIIDDPEHVKRLTQISNGTLAAYAEWAGKTVGVNWPNRSENVTADTELLKKGTALSAQHCCRRHQRFCQHAPVRPHGAPFE